jgi:hypothetical protein
MDLDGHALQVCTEDSSSSGEEQLCVEVAGGHALQACAEGDSSSSGEEQLCIEVSGGHALQACSEGDSSSSGEEQLCVEVAGGHAWQACSEGDSSSSGEERPLVTAAGEHASQACSEDDSNSTEEELLGWTDRDEHAPQACSEDESSSLEGELLSDVRQEKHAPQACSEGSSSSEEEQLCAMDLDEHIQGMCSGDDSSSDDELAAESALRSPSRFSFSYSEVFAGTSAIGERIHEVGGIPVAFIEIDRQDLALLGEFYPEASRAGDFYARQWAQWATRTDVLFGWPMCKHVSAAGRQRMQHDEVASQLWELSEVAVLQQAVLVVIENPAPLEELDHQHGLLSRAVSVFETTGYTLSAVVPLQDSLLGGQSARRRIFIVFERVELEVRMPLLIWDPPDLGWTPMMGSLSEVGDVSGCVLRGSLCSSDCWRGSVHHVGRFTFSEDRPLQAGSTVQLQNETGWWCVFTDDMSLVRVRSTNRKSPRFLMVPFSRVRCLGTTPVIGIDGTVGTLRSSPDPPGNCLVLDWRLGAEAVRSLTPSEEWNISGRCPEKLKWLLEEAPDFITHKAGKAITGCMSAALADLVAWRLKCAVAVQHELVPCLGVDALGWQTPVWFAVICYSTGCVLTSPCQALLPGRFMPSSRESAVKAGNSLLRALVGEGVQCEAFLAGEATGPNDNSLVIACPVLKDWRLCLKGADLSWQRVTALLNDRCKLLASTAMLRIQMLAGPTERIGEVEPAFRAGVVETKMVAHLAGVDPHMWEQHCQGAASAVSMLLTAYDLAIAAEPQARVAGMLAGWRDRVMPFCAEDIPPDLRGRIPFPEYSAELFPEPHLAPVTEWMPRKPLQPRVNHWVDSVQDIFAEEAWGQIGTFNSLLTAWMEDPTANSRPRAVAIGQGGLQPWAQGVVLDLRQLVKGVGWVTELDFGASTPTQFNVDYIRERLKDYPDQELVSHLVLGVRMLADLDLQLVLLPHLLSIEGVEEEVLREVMKLSVPPFEWVGFSESLPFVPGRYIGKGVVPKAGDQIRPIDEGGGPRSDLFDSDGFFVWALNAAIEGREDWDNYSEDFVFMKGKASKLPKESKPTARHVRIVIRILRAAARAAGMPLNGFLSDLEKYFNQFMLAPEEYWKSNTVWSRRRYTSNYCMTFGVTSASNIAQRAGNSLVWIFLQDFEELDRPYREADAARWPALAQYLRLRKLLGDGQDWLIFMFIYTDDPIWIVVGADRLIRAQRLWLCMLEKFGLRAAGLSKQMAGVDLLWCGIRHNLFLGLTIIPADKALKGIWGLTLMLKGECTSQQGRSSLGLLEFCRYAVGIRDLRLYLLWCALKEGPGELMTLDEPQRQLAASWISLLGTCSGSAVSETFEGVQLLPDTARVWSVSSDAALEPLSEAGMGGYIHGLWWRVPRDSGLQALTIPVAELLAAGVSLEVLYAHLGSPQEGAPAFWVRWEIDALAGVFVLAKDSARAEVMRFTLDRIKATRAYRYFLPALILCHVYGVANVASDAASRGLLTKLAALTRSFGCTLQEVCLPAAALELIDSVVLKAESLLPSVSKSEGGVIRVLSLLEQSLDGTVANTPTSASFLKVVLPARSGIQVALAQPGILKRKVVAPARTHSGASEVAPVRAIGTSAPLVKWKQTVPPARGQAVQQAAPVPRESHTPTEDRALLLAGHLGDDLSKYAFCRDQPAKLRAMCRAVDGLMARSLAPGTEKKDALGWRRWCTYCKALGTTPWRDDPAAVSGLDSVAYRREVVLCVNFVIECHKTIKPRPAGSNRKRCKPESAMNVLREVRRVFKKAMVPLMPLTAVTQALRGIMREFLKDYGPAALTPKRAAPFTNELLKAMFAQEGTLKINSVASVDWSSFKGINLMATLALATCTGMRKSELVSDGSTFALTRGSVAFLIGGTVYSKPTLTQLQGLTVRDFLVIVPPPSKSDQFGIVWGSLPIYVPVRHVASNAALLVARILLLQPDMPATCPLLCSEPGKAFSHYFLITALDAWLMKCGVPPQQVKFLTWHSARVYLACALLAAGRSPETIQAMLRWQTVDSLRIYACLSASAYAAHLDAALVAPIAAIRGAHIPLMDSIDLAYNIQQGLN